MREFQRWCPRLTVKSYFGIKHTHLYADAKDRKANATICGWHYLAVILTTTSLLPRDCVLMKPFLFWQIQYCFIEQRRPIVSTQSKVPIHGSGRRSYGQEWCKPALSTSHVYSCTSRRILTHSHLDALSPFAHGYTSAKQSPRIDFALDLYHARDFLWQ
jgi:hypothetical protein